MILEGDCLDILPTLPAGYRCILADPPYGVSFESTRRLKPHRKPVMANDGQPFVWFLHEAYRLASDPGGLFCFTSWQHAEAFRSAIQWAGFRIKGQLVWDRVLHGMADLKTCFAPQHDLIWYATKGRLELNSPRPKSVISALRPTSKNGRHPTEKPVPLLTTLLAAVCRKGDKVLDPCCGSGSAGEACAQLGLDFTGIELNPVYADMARQRLHM
jgi:site-specific DNA-methyltransferase (adenine-specific)